MKVQGLEFEFTLYTDFSGIWDLLIVIGASWPVHEIALPLMSHQIHSKYETERHWTVGERIGDHLSQVSAIPSECKDTYGSQVDY